ncbi:MAG: sugar ABC transporter substrate-binding protein, partial [Alphaproteobacteria bacterium]|nr:sugar ABC transporter substrate-binding protein [Alphaproteobacteria bacterium]
MTRILLFAAISVLAACSSQRGVDQSSLPQTSADKAAYYQIGPGDTLKVFVWRNPDLTVTVPVR